MAPRLSLPALTRRSLLAGAGAAALIAPRLRAQGDRPLRVVQPWEIRSMQPSEAGFSFTRPGVLETLVAADPGGSIVPAIAESWQVSTDAKEWRFRIRDGVLFHDGTPCDPAAIKASFEALLDRSLYLKRTGIEAIETTATEVVFRLAEPFGPMLAYLVDNSTAIVAPAGFGPGGEVERLIGTGPFALRDLDLPRGMVLDRFADYWGEPAAVPGVLYDAVANAETRGNIAIAGDADLTFNIPAPAVSRVEAAGAMRVERPIIPRVHILMLNCALPQFADRRTRQALNMALDRQAMAAGIMRNPALAATQYMPPVLENWHYPDLAPHRHDVGAANALLDEAGWTRGPDGVRRKDGTRFAGTIRTFANRPELPVIAQAMQQQFAAIGFDLSISVGEWSAIVDGQRDGTLELGLSSRNLTIVPDPIATVALDFTSDTVASGAVGVTNWRDDDLRRLVAAYLAEGSEAELPALRRRIVEIIQTEVPLIPVVWYDQIVAMGTGIEGFVSDPFEQRLRLNALSRRA